MRIQTHLGWGPALVTGKRSEAYSYTIETPNGNVYKRDRRNLRDYSCPLPLSAALSDHAISEKISADSLDPSGEEDHSTPYLLPVLDDSAPTTADGVQTKTGHVVRLPARFKDYVIG